VILSESFEAVTRSGATGSAVLATPSTLTMPGLMTMALSFLPSSMSKRIKRSSCLGAIEHLTDHPPVNVKRIGMPTSSVKPRAR
jgi:hypothetical protein